jgi:hypothetical protein
MPHILLICLEILGVYAEVAKAEYAWLLWRKRMVAAAYGLEVVGWSPISAHPGDA